MTTGGANKIFEKRPPSDLSCGMENTVQCVVVSHVLGSSPELEIIDKIKEIYNERNTQGILKNRLFGNHGIDYVKQIAVGPSSLGVLLQDGEVIRISMHSKVHQVPLPPTSTAPTTNSNSQSTLRSSVPKFRRVMLSAGTFRRSDRGVVIDGRRPMIPATSVPEDLISQAQVVLQGKSREVIVRELQRTNLNVNEAVNNLLSRDDDEEDDEAPGEVVLPEELLSLLDPSSQHPLLEAADLYNADFEYVLGRDMLRRRAEKDKEKKSKDNSGSQTPTSKSRVDLDDESEYWAGEMKGVPEGVEKFAFITATGSELLAVTDKGILYSWPWNEVHGDSQPHVVATRLIPEGDCIVNIASSRLRIMIQLKSGMICSWLDHHSLGMRVCQATEVKPAALALNSDEVVVQLVVSNHLAVARTSSNAFFWCGLYPFNDRPKIWEKERNKSKKHVTFDTGSHEIKEGSEVRTKSSPIYAVGSVAVNISGPVPSIGVLMESVWTLTEVVRFRVVSPMNFDQDVGSETAEGSNKSLPLPGDSRKRRPSRDVFESAPKEEVWGVCDVIWIHEQQTQDVAIVRIVDGAYVGVEYTSNTSDMTYASSLSGSIVSKDATNTNTGRIRLMRKDELTLVTPKLKSTRSPKIMLKEPTRFNLSGSTSRKVISAVAESTGIRALVEKRSRLFITRCSTEGKILSEHLLPVFPASLYGPLGEAPCLQNYGEDSYLMLKDGNGAIIPLVRDSVMGFREPVAMNQPYIRHSGLFINVGAPSSNSAKTPTRKAALVAIAAPAHAASGIQLPSILQHVLFCDTAGVKRILDSLHETGDGVRTKNVLLNERSDNGCSVIHAAIRLSIAAKNKDDVDPGTTHGIRLREDETKMAREEARDLDQRWQRLIRANRSGNDGAREEPSVIQAAPIQDNAVQSPGDSSNDAPQDMPAVGQDPSHVVSDAKERQKKSIEMIGTILEHPATQPLLFQLLSHRDYGGLTPFQAAINIRAYGAATTIWNFIKTLIFPPSPTKPFQLPKEPVPVQKLVHPVGSRPDDNPLFLLCFNDTCSFTWTGEEHINQDIFECRTCGLTGTLCCCTECAFTCHRNHDCKLKRTSPTAYCDCWEKCPCKALIAGNQDKREALLKELLKHTKLFEQTNNRGEHIMLFLARTLGRQQNEQSNSNKRRRHPAATSHADPSTVPEHDLEPPKFARFALEACINEWSVVQSLIEIGVRNHRDLSPSYEEVLCLNAQNGSTHLDKFVFTLLAKCGDQLVGEFLDSIVARLHAANPQDRLNMDKLVARFVRSVLRIYLLLLLMSPNAAATAIRGKSTAPQSQPERRNYQTINVSGLFSIVRHSDNTKETKQHNLANVILRSRNVLMRLVPFAVEQTAYVADTLLAPVRYGILRPSSSLTVSPNQDCLETLEKFLNSEYDLTTQLAKLDDTKDKPHRKRKPSRRDTDRGDDDETARRDDSDDDSDSDGDAVSSRRHNSQSGMHDAMEMSSEGADRGTASTAKYRNAAFIDDDGSDAGSSSSESDSEDDEDPEEHVLVEDDENVDEDEPEEDDHDERYGENSEGDQEDQSNYNEDQQRNENDYPSPTYDNSFAADTDSQDASRMEEDVPDDEERRDGNVVDAPPEDEDNTRDAVHSEASSADNAEAAEDRTENEPAEQLALRIPRFGRRPVHGRGRTHPALSWTSRLRYDDSEDDNADRDAPRSGSAAQTRAPPSSQNNTGAATSPAEPARRGSSDSSPSVFQTSHQLALAFSFSIRLLCDLMRKLHTPPDDKLGSVKYDTSILMEVMTRVLGRMEGLWNWMYAVLDRMEAQLRFGNAIMLSGAAEVRQKPSKKRDSSGGKKDKSSEESPATSSRKEAMEYFVATMRGQAREAGDDYPLIDVDTLRTLVFVFDAYLNYHDALISCKNEMDPENAKSPIAEPSTQKDVHRFFQRSNSVCFPGAATSDAWDTLSKNGSRVPLAERSHLLSPDADLTTLFAPSPSPMTWKAYLESSMSLGVPHILNMSLVSPADDVEETEELMDEEQVIIDGEGNLSDEMEIVESDDEQPPNGLEGLSIHELRSELREPMANPANTAMARWKNVVQFIAKECHHELLLAYGGEISSDHLLSTVARFPVRQAMFRKTMDKFRGLQTKDISLEVHREPVQLIRDAVFQLNQTHVRRQNAPKGRDDSNNGQTTVLGSGRVKVRFFEEPGEGTGVARSFYTALAEALQSCRRFPFEELGWEGGEDYLYGSASQISFTVPAQVASTRERTISRIAVIRDRGTNSAILSRKRPSKRLQLSAESEPYTPEDIPTAEARFNTGNYKSERVCEQPSRTRDIVAEAIYFKVKQLRPNSAARIAGMLVDAPLSIMMHSINSPELFKQHVDDAVALLLKIGHPADMALLSSSEDKSNVQEQGVPHPSSDDAPLFSRTCRRGLYTPVPGKLSPMRLNAFRNIGRVIGLSLSQGELFPLKLCRHLLKYILDRPIRWLDLQFFDPQIFESMRQLLSPENDKAFFESMDLRFSVDITTEDVEGIQTIPLKEGGQDIPVTRRNVVEYVYLFVQMKLLGPDNIQCFSMIKQGIADVIPLEMLQGLSAEDMRLLMCGADQVCISTLQAVTSFADESHAAAETLDKFKQWFWSVVEGLSPQEKQELIFFWTGSPSLPTSPEALQPQPTVMVRPPDDVFLPTANTCISRLYVPLYSSKKLLRAKLQLAIKAKNFGFV